MKKIIIHIGIHRTATTALQSFLRENKLLLEDHSIRIPETGYALGSSHQLPWCFLRDLPTHYPVSPLSHRELFNNLIEEIDSRPESIFILSSEDFCLIDKDSAKENPSLDEIANYLKKYDVTIIAYLRNQVEFISSYLNQAIKAYDTRIVPQTAESVNSYFKNVLDYEKLLERWGKAFGEDNLCVRSFHLAVSEDGIIADFLSQVGIEMELKTSTPTNQSLDEKTLSFRKYLNTLPVETVTLADLESGLNALSRDTPAASLDRATAKKYQGVYTEINQRVAASFSPLNPLNFLPPINDQLYPEILTDRHISLDDKLNLSNALFAQLSSDHLNTITRIEQDFVLLREDLHGIREDTHQARDDFHMQRDDFQLQRKEFVKQEEEYNKLKQKLLEIRGELNELKESHSYQVHALQDNLLQSEHIHTDMAMQSFRRARRAISPRRRLNETFGKDERIIQFSPLFDESYYRDLYLKDSTTRLTAAKHYLKIGAAAGFNPSAHFNTIEYIRSHAHVALAGINPIVHAEQTRYTLPESKTNVTAHKKQHIVIIDHEIPKFDQNAGARHTHHYIKLFLELDYDVTFLPFCDDPVDLSLLQSIRQMGVTVLTHEEENKIWTPAAWHGWLETNQSQINLVYIHRPHVAEHYMSYCKNILELPVWYMCHDLHYLRLQREAAIKGKDSEQALIMKEKERHFFAMADLNFTPSREEERLVREEFGITSIKTLPLYLYDDQSKSSSIAERSERILFVGSFQHQPNIDGLRWFIEHIYPKIKTKTPNILIDIVGKNPPSDFTSLEDSQLIFHGYVGDEELELLYAQVKVVVMPLRYGAGVKGKVLEAMRHGVPFVATSCALEGIPELAGIIPATDDDISFANAVLTMLTKNEHDLKILTDQFAEIIQTFYSLRAGKSLMAPLLEEYLLPQSERTNQ